MNERYNVDFDAVDFDAAVDEVDILVPKYLEALQDLEITERFEDMQVQLGNVKAYWTRLNNLLGQIAPLEHDIPVKQILMDSLQTELSVLEQLYLSINLRIQFAPSRWTEAMWDAGDAVLIRMDEVLGELTFGEDHKDRVLIKEILEKNESLRNQKNKF